MSEQEDKDLRELQGVIAFGLDTKVFMGTTLGRFLHAKANAEIAQAEEALLDVDPEDPKAIRKLQNTAAVARSFLLWIGEAVQAGENAEREFESR